MDRVMHLQQVRESEEPVKFVKLKDGTYRFFSNYVDHKAMVGEGEEAVAAGTIGVYGSRWSFISTSSMTLNINCNPVAAGEEITKLLGLPQKDSMFY